jgi:hypothetical protein
MPQRALSMHSIPVHCHMISRLCACLPLLPWINSVRVRSIYIYGTLLQRMHQRSCVQDLCKPDTHTARCIRDV